MEIPGVAAIAKSKALGLWDAYEHVDLLQVPQDLREGLDAQPQAASFFDAAAPSYRRNVLRWINSAKRPQTRVVRIEKTKQFSALGNKISQFLCLSGLKPTRVRAFRISFYVGYPGEGLTANGAEGASAVAAGPIQPA